MGTAPWFPTPTGALSFGPGGVPVPQGLSRPSLRWRCGPAAFCFIQGRRSSKGRWVFCWSMAVYCLGVAAILVAVAIAVVP